MSYFYLIKQTIIMNRSIYFQYFSLYLFFNVFNITLSSDSNSLSEGSASSVNITDNDAVEFRYVDSAYFVWKRIKW